MATLTETTVDIRVTLRRRTAEDGSTEERVMVDAVSRTADGVAVRAVGNVDVTDLLNQSHRDAANTLLTAAINYAKSRWNIP